MRSRRGETLAFTTLDDRSGRIELSVFADVYELHKAKIFKDAVLVVEGEVQPDEYTRRIEDARRADLHDGRGAASICRLVCRSRSAVNRRVDAILRGA